MDDGVSLSTPLQGVESELSKALPKVHLLSSHNLGCVATLYLLKLGDVLYKVGGPQRAAVL